MTFSQYAGTAIVPTLARLVLAAAFVSTGWNKVFKNADFTLEQATQLKGLNVSVDPPLATASLDNQNSTDWRGTLLPGDANMQVVLARYSPQDPASPPADTAAPPASPPPATTEPAATTKPTLPPGVGVGPAIKTGVYKAQGLHHVTLLLANNNIPQPVWMARLAAFTELIGGAMLLLGLFSRLWGLGLAIAMGMAFYLVSMKTNGIFTMDPRTFAENGQAFGTAYLQLGLFVLAFGILCTGPGPLSLDRMLFGGPDDANTGDAKID